MFKIKKKTISLSILRYYEGQTNGLRPGFHINLNVVRFLNITDHIGLMLKNPRSLNI